MGAEYVDGLADLVERYGERVPAAVTKEMPHLTEAHRRFIEASPFMIVATSGTDGEGVDCSPRGDPAGSFVRVTNANTILIPDRRGNNRIDSLRNLVVDPRIGLLFMIPGIGHTMRVNGAARLRVDDEIRESFRFQDKVPALVIEVAVDRAYSQCPKALMRSALWNDESRRSKEDVPSVGEMMEEIDATFDGKDYDENYAERSKLTIY